MKKIFISMMALASMMMTSCFSELDTMPIDDTAVVTEQVYRDYNNYPKVLAKLYAGFAVSGQGGPDSSDIDDINPGYGQYFRGLFHLQQLTTDEAICNWGDKTIKDMHNMAWTSSDVFVGAMYNRIFFQVATCNEFLRQTTQEKLTERGLADKWEEVKVMRAEARFIRAYSYWNGIDLFGSIPFVDETGSIGTTTANAPKQKSRKEIAEWIENEIIEIEEDLPVSGNAAYYGRATQGAAWTLMAKLYLNYEAYTGIAKWTECITYCNKVIGAGYSLAPSYENMFLADNDVTSKQEFIFAVIIDGLYTQSFGGTTYLVNGSTGGKMNKEYMGGADWGGLRTTKALVERFGDPKDKRAKFFTQGQTLDIPTNDKFEEGYAVMKFRNVKSDGTKAQDAGFADIDIPVFRLADIYLMYAEAVERGGTGGTKGQAITYLNLIRQRAYGDATGNIGSYDLDFIINERSRELYWEWSRRTDLVRFDMFTSDKLIWPWKGGAPGGKATADKYKLFPLAASDVMANPNLKQNQGY